MFSKSWSLILAFALCSPVLLAQIPKFKVVDVEPGVPQANDFLPSRINSSGEIAGTLTFPARERAAIWSAGVVTDLGPSFGHDNNQASHINDLGQVVGTSWTQGGGRSAYLWDTGFTQLPAPYARGLNDHGVVVGATESTPGIGSAWVWDSQNGRRDLPTLGGCCAQANAVNDLSTIVGQAMTANGSLQAVLWRNGIPLRLSSPRALRSDARDINDSDIVVGSWEPEFGQVRAFRYDQNGAQDLGKGEATAINNAGWTVGFGVVNKTQQRAMLWFGGQQYNLNHLIAPDPIRLLEFAVDVNDQGQIIGFGRRGSQQRPFNFLLEPIVPDVLDLSGDTQVSTGSTASYSLTNAPANTPYRIYWAQKAEGSWIGTHWYEVGPHAAVAHSGVTSGGGTAHWTSAPLPAKLAGRRIHLEAGIDTGAESFDSNRIVLDVL